MSADLEVRLLGPLEVRVAGRRVQFDGAKQRALFTALALKAPDPLTVDDLVEAVWAHEPPGGPVQALQKQVSRLRQRLGDAAPVHRGASGYALGIDPEAIDARRFEKLLQSARGAIAQDDPESAARDLDAALALWRGPALADHRFADFAQLEIGRLDELRMEAVEERLGAQLAGGGDADLVSELRTLVAEHPLRERLRAHLMLALYRSGRQAEALEVMREGRRQMIDELGIEPGPDLRRLEQAILAHDPDLHVDRTARAPPAALPAPAGELIGRDGELAEIVGLLDEPGVRLLTLVGTGGVGKTRLALEAAHRVAARFPGGAVHVDLDGVEVATLLESEVAAALGVVAHTGEDLAKHIVCPTLLVLDGFERLLADAGEVSRLLAAAAPLTVLATSRAALRLGEEHIYHVQTLALESAAVLFEARARRSGWSPSDGDQPVVDAICARLDGLPLAIELAADRVRLLPPKLLLARLERRLDVLTESGGDRPARHRSLRATLEWSWEVLEEPERRLLSRLTVFEGGASVEAAAAVCDDGTLGGDAESVMASLLNRTSLLRAETREQEVRLAMLETIREFAAERGDPAATERRHARYFVGFAERLAHEAARSHRRESLDRLAAERGNLRLAFERLLRAGAVDEALRIAIAFAEALPWDAHANEVRGWLDAGLAAPDPCAGALRATALYWDGRLAISQASFADAETRLRAALDAAQQAGEPELAARVLIALGRWATLVRHVDGAQLADAALETARATGDRQLVADALLIQAGARERRSDWPSAVAFASDALGLYRELGDPYGAATALAELGWYDLVTAAAEHAEEYFDEALELRRRHGDDRRLVEPLINGAWLALVQGDSGIAQARFLDCLAMGRQVDDGFIVGEALAGLSSVAGTEGRWTDCAQLAGASALVHEQIGAPPWDSVTMLHERETSGARAALGPAYDEWFGRGRTRPADEVVQRTLEPPALGLLRT